MSAMSNYFKFFLIVWALAILTLIYWSYEVRPEPAANTLVNWVVMRRCA